MDPVKSRKPEMPLSGPGTGGRVASAGNTLSSYITKKIGVSLGERIKDDKNPREALLSYAKDAAEHPYWVTPAYKKNQPVTIFNTDEDGPDAKKPKLQMHNTQM